MTPINGQRLFYLNATDIWVGEDLESCMIAAREIGWPIDCPRELTDDEAYKFTGGRTPGTLLAVELEQALNRGYKTPALFDSLTMPTIGQLFVKLFFDQAHWSQRVFGSDASRGPLGALKHLQKEAGEAQSATWDITEFADCLLLSLEAGRRAGFTLPQLIDACIAKQVINRARRWPAPGPGDEPTEHVRESDSLGVLVLTGGYPHQVPAFEGSH